MIQKILYIFLFLCCKSIVDYKTEKFQQFLETVKSKATKGEQLYQNVSKNVFGLSPIYEYDPFTGYKPNPIYNKTENLYKTIQQYQQEGYNSDIIKQIYQNLYTINPYALARTSPIGFLNADRFPEKSYNQIIDENKGLIPHHASHSYEEHFPSENPMRDEVPHQLQEHANKNLFPDYFHSQFAFKQNETQNETINIQNNTKDNSDLNSSINQLKNSDLNSSMDKMRFKQNYTMIDAKSQRTHFLDKAKLMAAIRNYKQIKNMYIPVKAPIYVPFPIVSYYSVPVIDHYNLDETVEKLITVPEYIKTFRNQSDIQLRRKTDLQTVLIPQAVPYGIKVPTFITEK